jgi:hypothetical protein
LRDRVGERDPHRLRARFLERRHAARAAGVDATAGGAGNVLLGGKR